MFAGWSSSRYASTIGTLRGSEFLDGVYWNYLLSWDLSWFNYFGFSWTISLPGTLRGIAGGLALLNISARVFNASLCPLTSLVRGFSGARFCSA